MRASVSTETLIGSLGNIGRKSRLAHGISVIAIDGPAAAGKTAVGRELARTLGFAYLDTGIMYRAVTWLALHKGISVDDTTSLGDLARANPMGLVADDDTKIVVAGLTLGPELREPSVDSNVSAVSKATSTVSQIATSTISQTFLLSFPSTIFHREL